MKRRSLLTFIGRIAAGLALVPGSRALAQEIKPGRVTGRAFETLAPSITINLAPLDDSAENLRVRDEMRRVLLRAGHRMVESGAGWRLSFATEIRPLASGGSAAPRGPEASTGQSSDLTDRSGLDLPDRPLRRPPAGINPSAARGLRYVINATVEDAKTGKRAWQGNVQYDDAEADRTAFLVRLVQPLLSEFGKNQQGRRFALD